MSEQVKYLVSIPELGVSKAKSVEGWIEWKVTVKHKSGGIGPFDVTVTIYVNGASIGSRSGTIQSPGGSVSLPSINWTIPGAGTYSVKVVGTITDETTGLSGTGQVSLTVIVEEVTAPEIEIIIEVG